MKLTPNNKDLIEANRLWFDVGYSQDDAIIYKVACALARARARERKALKQLRDRLHAKLEGRGR